MKKLLRILKYLENQGITPTTFERETKLSNGYFKNTLKREQDITPKILDRIKENAGETFYKIFPEEKENANNESQEHKTTYVVSEVIEPAVCLELKIENGFLKQRINDLERTINDKNEIIVLQRQLIPAADLSKRSV